MVYNSKTFEVYHQLTKAGDEEYKKMLERVADEILYKHEHPFKYFFEKYVIDPICKFNGLD